MAESAATNPNDGCGRLVAVAIRDADEDAAVLTWVAGDAVVGADAIHVVHSYVPLHLEDCTWTAVTRARDDRRRAAGRTAVLGAQRLRALRPALRVDSTAIAGLPTDVLAELSTIADLVVVGADRPRSATGVHHVAQHVLRRACCPVVCVPRGYRAADEARPVTVVADDRGLPEPALDFAADYARRHGLSVQVSRAWSTLHEGNWLGSTWLAQQQEKLDAELASWSAQQPRVPVSARIELTGDWLPRLAERSSLLVVPAAALAVGQRSSDPAWQYRPTAVVPPMGRVAS